MDGQYLKNLRVDAGLTQKQMAEKLGYMSNGVPNRSHIARIENGHQPIKERLVLAVKYVCEKYKQGLPIEYGRVEERWQDILAAQEERRKAIVESGFQARDTLSPEEEQALIIAATEPADSDEKEGEPKKDSLTINLNNGFD